MVSKNQVLRRTGVNLKYCALVEISGVYSAFTPVSFRAEFDLHTLLVFLNKIITNNYICFFLHILGENTPGNIRA